VDEDDELYVDGTADQDVGAIGDWSGAYLDSIGRMGKLQGDVASLGVGTTRKPMLHFRDRTSSLYESLITYPFLVPHSQRNHALKAAHTHPSRTYTHTALNNKETW
jgi:hypothetical protein